MSAREVGLPMTISAAGLPSAITIWEVGARDGLQNEKTVVPTEIKVEFIERLATAGLPIVEATSFVRPEWVPQLADAAEVMTTLAKRYNVRYPVLVPNERGLDRALECGATDIAVFASATETFAQKNLNRSYDEQWAMFEPTVAKARATGAPVRGYLSMCFGDPWEGAVAPERVADAAAHLRDMGCTELSLGDTIGVATAGHVESVIRALLAKDIDVSTVGVHFHDTYGQALANTLAALRCGVTIVDSSAGGLGGCPYAKSATGNLATEDLVWMLNGLGISTGVDLDALAATSAWMADQLGRPSPSRVVRALTGTN
ncbi:MAG: hydroxymethylglutaryl-CoA lyase [Actinobacteria bacterium]|nr:hydroxymethylglutaryl-CoA lyase [Actinomycetota bacterium]